MSGGVTTEVVRGPDRLRELEPEWRTLASRRGNAFVTPEWLFAWLEHYGDSGELSMVALRAPDGSLRGLMPLVRERGRGGGQLRFGGANLADHLHPVADAGAAEIEIGQAVGASLGSEISGWSAVVLDHVEENAGWLRAMTEAAPVALSAVASRATRLPYIELPESWEAYLTTRSRNFRSQIGRKLRRLEQHHDVRFRHTNDASELAGDLETFFRLHDARWDPRGGSSSRTERARRFHADFSRAALARGWLRQWSLEIDGEPAASWYGWRLGGRYSYYLAGFEPRWADASVGLLLLAHTVRAAIEEGASEYDLLLGEEDYKRRFADSDRPVETVILARARRPVRMLASADAALWRGYARLSPGARERARSLARVAGRALPWSRRR
jgi:CelD/BcsL family acetyltransferase involved in cellulose biosynthesis